MAAAINLLAGIINRCVAARLICLVMSYNHHRQERAGCVLVAFLVIAAIPWAVWLAFTAMLDALAQVPQ